MRLFTFVCVLLLASLCTLRAADDPVEGPPSKVLVRERTVYVPYEKLKETFEKEGRGVFLPYEEFLKLWNAAQPVKQPPEEIKPPAEAVISGGSYVGVANEHAVRFDVTYTIRALGKNWSEIALPLKNVAIESVTLSDPAAVFAPKGDGYTLAFPKPGEYTLTLAFSVRIDSKPGFRKIEFGIPPTAVSRLEISIPEKDVQVDVTPKMAATVATPGADATKVLAFVGNAAQVAVTWMPPVSKLEKGKSIVIASQASVVNLSERILRIDTAINYRIESKEEDTFRIKLPPQMNLLRVNGNNIRERPEANGELTVHLHTPAKDSYALALSFERILDTTPENLDIVFPAAIDALREDGFVTVTHDPGLRLRVEKAPGLSQIDARELPDAMRGGNLLAGFRYVAQPIGLSLKIDTILPKIQSSVTSVANLGLEEDTLVGWVDYTITKAGIFTVKLKFPNRWDVASVGDPNSIEDFQTAVAGNDKILTVNLKNKAMGALRLPFKLTAPGRAAPGDLALETIQVLDTVQDAGVFGVSAPKAFKLTTVERNKMVSANIQALVKTGVLGQLPQDSDLPLAYSYTAQPASVKIGIERRQTEIRVSGTHTIIVAEGGLTMQHKLVYDIAYAGTDKLAFSVPTSLDDKLFDVKCAAMKEKKKAGETNGRTKWEVSLQEKTLGVIVIDIVYRENIQDAGPEKPQDIVVPDIRAEDVNAQSGVIAVRKESAWEIQPTVTNLEALDPANLPPELRPNNTDGPGGNVYLAYRFNQAERSLTLKLTRHVSVNVSSAIVDLLRATFVVIDEHLTANVDLYVENAKSEQSLALLLPKGAIIRPGTTKPDPQKREKDGAILLKLPAGNAPFWMRIVYELPRDSAQHMGLFGSLELSTPEILDGVPVNKIEADLFVPEEFKYFNFGGTLQRRENADAVSNTFEWLDHAVRSPDQPRVLTGTMPNSPRNGFGDSFATIGKQFRFQTLAARGTISLNYCEHKLFTLIDVLALIGAFVAGWILIRRLKYPQLWVCVGFVFVPLCWSWLATSDFGEIPRCIAAAGILLSVVCALIFASKRMQNWRDDRIARAPDPFLEDAVTETAPPASPSIPPAPPTPPAEGKKPDSKRSKNGGGK